MERKRIVILGGGFAGIYAAKHLEKLFKNERDAYEIVLVNRENYFTFQPMLAEVVGGALGILDSVSAIRSLLKHSTIYVREVTDIDIATQTITLSPNFNHTDLTIRYDYLVIALGNVTDFRTSHAGLREHSLPFKNLADAFKLRNRVIDVIETAAIESNPALKKQLLTFVVGGGGFSGVEVVAEINDFARRLAKKYKTIDPKEIRVYLIHSKDRLVDRELSPSLGRYAEKILRHRGVEILFKTHLTSATPYEAILDDEKKIPSSTIVSSVPSTQNPLLEKLPFEMLYGRVKTSPTLRVLNSDNVWALGDAAAIPVPGSDAICPPTAQFAVRQGKCVAKNIYNTIKGKKEHAFAFKALGMMAALGHHRAVAEIFGCIKLSGFFAWICWRFVYWLKLPGFTRKIKVGFSWLVEMLVPEEAVQLKTEMHDGIKHLHYCKGEVVFQENDVGDYLYVIVSGKVEILEKKNNQTKVLATLTQGEYFGEMALLNQKRRNATVLCVENTELIAIRKHDFHILITNFGNLREDFLKTESLRKGENPFDDRKII